jgi:hypothetical protein
VKTLTYWIADCLNDSKAYSKRAKTRKAVAALVRAGGAPEEFGKPRKIEVPYNGMLDLVQRLLGEGGAEGTPAEADA